MRGKVLIAGIDGFIGFALAQNLVAHGFEVYGIDNLFRRKVATSITPIASVEDRVHALSIGFEVCDVTDWPHFLDVLRRVDPDAIVYLAHQPSAPYSMKDRDSCFETTFTNTIGPLNLVWALRELKMDVHVIVIGTLGEYAASNIPISEKGLEISYGPFKEVLPYPRRGISFYHDTKILGSLYLELACNCWGLTVTDVMQGVVFGVLTEEIDGKDELLFTRFDADECFLPGTKVTCSSGDKTIEDVRVGDEVLTHKGRFRKVLKTFKREYEGEVIEIELERSFGKLICTPEHPILATTLMSQHSKETTRWMTARELKEWLEVRSNPFLQKYKEFKRLILNKESILNASHKVGICYDTGYKWYHNYKKPRETIGSGRLAYLHLGAYTEVEDVKFLNCARLNRWTPDKYNPNRQRKNPLPRRLPVDSDFLFLCGLYLSDGCLNRSKDGVPRQVVISFHSTKDEPHRRRLCAYLEKIGLQVRQHVSRASRNVMLIYINSTALALLLEELFGQGAKVKSIPDWMMKLPPKKQQGLIEGLVAGDGHNGNNFEVSNETLCEQLRTLYSRQGRRARVHKTVRHNITLPGNGKVVKQSVSYTCHYYTGYAVKKHDLVRIKGITSKQYKGKVYNLHVEEDNTYVANGVVVHNCFGTIINRLCAEAATKDVSLTVYGSGNQKRGFLPLRDSIQCLRLLLENPPKRGEYRLVNQLMEVYRLEDLARTVKRISMEEFGIFTKMKYYPNPRVEREDIDLYKVEKGILDSLGYKPSITLEEEIKNTIEICIKYRKRIPRKLLKPRTRWRP